jgi:hypothetical protein
MADQTTPARPSASEPIKVFVLLWQSEDGPNCDLYRNAPALLQAQGDEYSEQAQSALDRPGEAVVFDADEGSVLRYMRVQVA